MNYPKYLPRAQFTGSLKWSCTFCGAVNKDAIRPGSLKLKCGRCKHQFFFGLAMHVPLNAATQLPKDHIIPSWAGDEYPFDTIPQRVIDSIPAAFMDLNKKVKQRGRVHVVCLWESLYLASPEPADEQPEPNE